MNVVTLANSVTHEFARICGAENVTDDPARLAQFSIDEVAPSFAVAPQSEQEVAAILRFCSEKNLVVTPAGGFSAQTMGAIPPRIDVLLQMHRMDRILFYDPGDLTCGVEAGCTAGRANAALGAHAQFLPLDAPFANRETVGGILARAAHGPLRHGYGGVRDYCIGIRFVTGDGKIAKGGGRVVKNVTGYDLMKLLIGSRGTLGVITSANFKVFPLPRQTRTFILQFGSAAEACAACARIASSPLAPIALELVNSRALEYFGGAIEVARDPDEHSPEEPLPRVHEKWQLIVRAAGNDTVLARYREELGGGSVSREEEEGDAETKFWNDYSQIVPLLTTRHRNAMVIELNVSPSAAEAAIAAIERAALDNNFLPAFTGRIALGVLIIGMVPLAVDPPSAMQYATAVSALRAQLPAGASVVVMACPTEAKRHFDVWGAMQTDLASMRKIKQALDPKNILNRGRYVA